MNTIDCKGRVAVVTGGGRGIGLAIAQRLSESGATAILWDRDAAAARDAARTLGDSARSFEVDTRDYESVERALAQTLDYANGVDILVNNAAIAGPNTTLENYPLDSWKDVIDIDLNGTFHCCRAIVPVMRGRPAGRIINIASIAGKEGNPNASAYSAAKAGVIALTKSLGKELVDTPIRVNCITPAAVQTDMFKDLTQQHIDYMLSKIPLRRFGTTAELAALVAWLASEECSFSTGAVFDISGGRATY
jgi:3-oxoacyl-[acyl-carrier protein] reductase